MGLSMWEIIVAAFAYGSGTGIAGGYVWAFFTAKARDDRAAANAPTEKIFVNSEGIRFHRCDHGVRSVGTDCQACILERADSSFKMSCECPCCRVVDVHEIVKWNVTTVPNWSPETQFTVVPGDLVGARRRCTNCGQEWSQK